jgi:hypothetical protein
MNKEQQELLDEAYEKYHQENKHVMYLTFLLEEEFINKCKTDQEFSEKWGLKIEERELSLLERREIARIKLNRKEWTDVLFLAFRQSHSRTLVTISTLHAHYKETYDKYNIPTRIITLSYNNKTATSYE